MLARVGLGPFEPPLGLPVSAPVDAPAAPAPAAAAVTAAAVVAPAPSSPPPPAPAPAPAPPLPPALAWTAAVGVAVTSPVRREADGMGRLTHIVSIVNPNSVGEPVECHHGAEPQLVPLAPPRSHFLGNDGTDVLYWLTPTGAVARTSAEPPPPPSSGVQTIPAPAMRPLWCVR